jgi:hypothetical protein
MTRVPLGEIDSISKCAPIIEARYCMVRSPSPDIFRPTSLHRATRMYRVAAAAGGPDLAGKRILGTEAQLPSWNSTIWKSLDLR